MKLSEELKESENVKAVLDIIKNNIIDIDRWLKECSEKKQPLTGTVGATVQRSATVREIIPEEEKEAVDNGEYTPESIGYAIDFHTIEMLKRKVADKEKLIIMMNNQLHQSEVEITRANSRTAAAVKESEEMANRLMEYSMSENDLKKQITVLKSALCGMHEIEARLNEAQKEVKEFRALFEQPMKLFKRYCSINSLEIECLSNLICTGNLMGFIVSCSNFANLESIWDYIRARLLDDLSDIDTINVLSDIFDCFFELYNSSLEQPEYQRCNVSVGDTFDNTKHIAGKNSSVEGKISQIQLLGYQSAGTGVIARKTIVIAGSL